MIGTVGQFSDLSFLDQRYDDLTVDKNTLASDIPGLFVVGGRKTGASYIIEAVALGHRVAASIDRYLQGQPLKHAAPPAPPVVKFAREESGAESDARRDSLAAAHAAGPAADGRARDQLPRSGAGAHRAAGARRSAALPAMRPVLRVPGVCVCLRRQRDRSQHGRARGEDRRRRRHPRAGLSGLPGRPVTRIRLRSLSERDHGAAIRALAVGVRPDPGACAAAIGSNRNRSASRSCSVSARAIRRTITARRCAACTRRKKRSSPKSINPIWTCTSS